ncbi:MAG: MATE family efflux transporter [Nocardioides sp.]|nr:MATE family efflux transporter [Nocardioides sp.]
MRERDRDILRLAVPAFLALVAEPLFLLGDAAVVGHLGTVPLAGLGLASVVLQTAVGLCVFLAYATTAAVSRLLGADDLRGALAQGIDGLWLATAVGAVLTVGGVLLADPLVGLFGAGTDVSDAGATYLRIASLGVVPLLLVLAATGVLRGLQDTRTPLVVAVAANALNLGLDVLLVFGAGPVPGLGIAGSAVASVIAQALAALALVAVVVRGARRHHASLRPDLPGVRASARAGAPLLVRTLTLRAALVATAYAVTRGTGGDPASVAAHQLAMTLWGFLAFALDAIAIAAQAVVGRALGADDRKETRALTRRMLQWGVWSGVIAGLGLAAVSPWIGRAFTPDADVHDLLVPVLLVAALGQPVAGVVFVLDGVLIGAGDGRYLAWAGAVVLVGYLPLLLAVGLLLSGTAALVGVWAAFAGAFMLGRMVTLVRRSRGEAWMVTGARV